MKNIVWNIQLVPALSRKLHISHSRKYHTRFARVVIFAQLVSGTIPFSVLVTQYTILRGGGRKFLMMFYR